MTQRHEVNKCCRKNGADPFPRSRVAMNAQFIKKKKKKKKKQKKRKKLHNNVKWGKYKTKLTDLKYIKTTYG